MNIESLTPALLVSAILSIVLEWSPGLSTWWHGLTPPKRAAINALLVALVSAVSVYGGCKLWGSVCPADMWASVWQIVVTALLAAAGNQAIHGMTKREVLQYQLYR